MAKVGGDALSQFCYFHNLLAGENVRWAVGIVGGDIYNIQNVVIYTGREGPAGGTQTTFDALKRRFSPR